MYVYKIWFLNGVIWLADVNMVGVARPLVVYKGSSQGKQTSNQVAVGHLKVARVWTNELWC